MRLLFVFIFISLKTYSQNTIGLPNVINFNKQAYKAGLQNWDIKQDKNGIVYLANNEGLLRFDGINWNLYSLTNKTIVRSVEIGKDSKVYVGGQDEIGFFEPDLNGRLRYHSLIELIPIKDRSFGDIWDITANDNDIFFRSSFKIFKFSNGIMSVYNAPSEWTYLVACNKILYAHDFKKGLFVFENNIWKPIGLQNNLPTNDPVTSMIQANKDSILITTLKNGIYYLTNSNLSKLKSSNNSFFEKERIYSATKINDEWLALGTNNAGVFIIDHHGEIVQSFSINEGLQNNNVLSIFLDREKNLWLGLDNGIDFILYNNAIKHIYPSSQGGAGYAAIIYRNKLFIGTSGNLFSTDLQNVKDLSFSKGAFSKVTNTAGQTWKLVEVNDQLLLGHHEGAFSVKENIAVPLSTNTGFWNFIPMSAVFPSAKTVSGNYQGISFWNYSNSTFSLTDTIQNFNESSRFIAIDRFDNIWMSHPYHGVYKLQLSNNGKYSSLFYSKKNGLPSILNNHVYQIKNELVVATEKGVFTYNYSTDLFEPSTFYKKILGDQSIRYLKEDKAGNIWFIHEKKLGVIDMSGNQIKVIYIPELNNEVLSGFEFIYPVDEFNIFVGGENGFFHINYDKYKKNKYDLNVQIRSVRIVNKRDSLLFGGYHSKVNEAQLQNKENIPSIAYKWNNIHFEFSSPLLSQQKNLEYSYKLKGFDQNWSEWSKKTEKEYTNLPKGTFSFKVKVRNNFGNESITDSYTFKLLPPWYQSNWAYFSYIILLITGFYFFYRQQQKKFSWQKRKFEEDQKYLLYMHELEMGKTEKELIALRNEKLQSEVEYKNSELAIGAMHLVQRGELLRRIKSELNNIIKNVKDSDAVNELKRMIKVLSNDEKLDEDWEHFAAHFDKVHSDFIVKLKDEYPGMTANELKLCTYLRMNLSTKEIAQLLNISVRGVEISRYRLRKKLGINTETNLFDFLINIQTKNADLH